MVTSGDRPAIFISHASPQDNAFVLWLGAKLSLMGYEVWADVLKLRGGDDWERKLEAVLRDRACKVLLVANPVAVAKQGVRNEIHIAVEVAGRIGDDEFVIPLRLAPYQSPFLVAQAQFIDFAESWTKGLTELLGTLSEKGVPRSSPERRLWEEIQLIHATQISGLSERLISNWVGIKRMPAAVRFHDFKAGIQKGRADAAIKASPFPLVAFRRGFLCFAPIPELQDYFGADLPLQRLDQIPTERFLNTGWPALGIERNVARRYLSDLFRQASEGFFKSHGLSGFEMSNRRLAWWPPGDLAPRTMIVFGWGDIAGRRQIQGASLKRKFRWHFGFTANFRSTPVPHVRLQSRLLFSEDGLIPFDAGKMHRLRRSFAKSWRNARWRDMQLAFLAWIADGSDEISIPTGPSEEFILHLPPMTFDAEFSVGNAGEEVDEDDPSDDDEPETWDEEDADPGEDQE